MVSALKLDPATVISEIHSLKPEVQLPLTQSLHTRCQALLNQWLDAGGPLRGEDALRGEDTQSLLAIGEALIRLDAAQPSWHLLLADIFTSLGVWKNGEHGPLPHTPDLCVLLGGERVPVLCLLSFQIL